MKQILFLILCLMTLAVPAQEEITIDTSYNGKNIEYITYKTNGLKTRRLEYHYIHKTLYSDISYSGEQQNGKALFYFKNGKLRHEYNYKNGRKEDLGVEYNENGQVRSKMFYKDGYLSGPCTWYFDNGNKESEGYYKNGDMDSLCIYYYPSGKKKMECSLKNGKRSGDIFYYNEKGDLFNGDYKEYDDAGLLVKEVKCVKGRPIGQSKVYLKGILTLTADYKNGLLEGDYNFYDKSGKVVKTWVYKNGQFVKEIIKN